MTIKIIGLLTMLAGRNNLHLLHLAGETRQDGLKLNQEHQYQSDLKHHNPQSMSKAFGYCQNFLACYNLFIPGF